MSFLLDALGKADDDRRRAEIPELKSYRNQPGSPLWRLFRYLLLLCALLAAFAAGYFFRPQLEAWLAPDVTVAVPMNVPTISPEVVQQAMPERAVVVPTEDPVADLGLELEVVSWSENPQARFAMINGVVVYEGDTLSSGEILLEIEVDAVMLNHAGETVRLEM